MVCILHNKITANDFDAQCVKACVLRYFRYNLCTPYACTELRIKPDNICDVAVVDKKDSFIEIEVKISWGDFIADQKKLKHEHYSNPDNLSYDVPNFFYYAAPETLAERISKYCEEQNLPYGVISTFPCNNKICDSVWVLRNPKKLTDRRISKDIFIKRMSSEIAHYATDKANDFLKSTAEHKE